MKKHYETHVEDTDKLISVAGPELDYKSWYEQYRKLMEEQAQRKYGLYTPTSEGDDDDFPSISGMIARYSALGLTNEQMKENPVWVDKTGNGHDLQMKNFAWGGMSGVGGYVGDFSKWVNNRDTTEIGITKNNSKVIIDVKVSQGSGKNIVFISKSNLGISNNVTIKITSTYVKNWLKDGAFLLEYRNIQADHLNKPISFGAIGSEMDLPHILTYQTSKSYNGVSITTGNFEGTDVLHVGKLAPTNVGTCINAAIWELVFLDHDATEEELTKIKDYFVKTYPWLFPDQAWTVVGKTNEDEDRATIANITGNGNDLVLSNFGFAEGSGYNEEGEYAGYLVTDGVDDKIVSSSFGMGKDFTIVGDWKFIDNKKNGTGLVKGSSFYIYNATIGLDLYINSGSVKNSFDGIKSINAACSDGRVYDPNWDEMLANTGNVVGSGGMLEVSSSGGRFDRIAFKNFAIYLRILSKDECIKAYNYLQTLKAK